MPRNVNNGQRWEYSIGRWSAGTMALLTLASLVAVPPARSGPNCTGSCVRYPYTDIGSYFPRDYWWMYPMVLVPLALIVTVLCVRQRTRPEQRVVGSIAAGLATLSAAVLSTNYFIQVTVIQPSIDRGEFDGVSLFTQYNPHGIFIAMEDLGYLLMGLTFLALAPLIGEGRLERTARVILIGGGGLAIGAMVGVSAIHGYDRGYWYEVIVLLGDWLVLIAAGTLLAVAFHRHLRRRARLQTREPPAGLVGGAVAGRGKS